MANRHEEPAYPHQQFSEAYLKEHGPQKPLRADEMPENQVKKEVVVEVVPVVEVEKKEEKKTSLKDK